MEFIFIIDEDMFDGWQPQLIKVIVLYSAIRSQFRFVKCVPCQDHLFPVVSVLARDWSLPRLLDQ